MLTRSKRAGSYVIDWGVELETQTKSWEKENQTTPASALAKRTATGTAELPDRGSKRLKTANIDDGMSDELMMKAFDKNQVDKVSRFHNVRHWCIDTHG